MRKYLIIGGAILAVVGLAIGGFWFLRSRSSGGSAVAGGETGVRSEQATPLQFKIGADKQATAVVTIPTDATGQPAIGVTKEMSSAEKAALGVPSGALATITVKPSAENSAILVGEIAVTEPVPSGAPAGTAALTAIIPVALPAASVGTVSTGIPKQLSPDERAALGLSADTRASITVTPVLGGGLTVQIDVSPAPPAEPGGDTVDGQDSGGSLAAPLPPTQGCGDFRCEDSESASSCPADCTLATEEMLDQRHGTYVVDRSTIQVLWISNVPTRGKIDYGYSEAVNLGSVEDGDFRMEHLVTIGGLNDKQPTVYYRVTMTDKSGNSRTVAGSTEFAAVFSSGQ